jgi:hypothetical protein
VPQPAQALVEHSTLLPAAAAACVTQPLLMAQAALQTPRAALTRAVAQGTQFGLTTLQEQDLSSLEDRIRAKLTGGTPQ